MSKKRASAAQQRREGRGRLSSIDLLPEEAEPDIVWALEQLRARDLTQKVIHAEFNERLMDKGIDPVSKSSFGRYSIRKALLWRKQDETQRIAGEMSQSLKFDGPDDVTILVAETIKVAAFELLEDGELNSKSLMELSRALAGAVQSQRGSDEYRKQLQARLDVKLEEAADQVEGLGREAGLSSEAIAKLRNDFLGVKSGARNAG